MGIVNVVGSSIARESDYICYTMAGPEIAVATTKAYSTQLVMSYILAVKFGQVRGFVSDEKAEEMIRELCTLPQKIQRLLDDKERIQWFASKFSNAHDIFFIGRGVDYAISLEGSLKMKEISYIHAEGYPAAEMKHGPIALVDADMPCLFIATHHEGYEKIISNMQEVKARGGNIIAVATEGDEEISKIADEIIYVPSTINWLVPLLSVIPLQLLSYYVAVDKGLNVDMPRNLAKSVTVE